jgi:hypothetical protein
MLANVFIEHGTTGVGNEKVSGRQIATTALAHR